MLPDQRPPKPYSGGEIPQVGDVVAVLDSEIGNYVKPVQSKIKGRSGVVSTLSYPLSYPVVMFPAQGRKKAYPMGIVEANLLRLVARVGAVTTQE